MYCMRVSLSQLVSAAPYRVAAYQVTQGSLLEVVRPKTTFLLAGVPKGSQDACSGKDDTYAAPHQDSHAYLARACITV
jgi:hypothetical protein